MSDKKVTKIPSSRKILFEKGQKVLCTLRVRDTIYEDDEDLEEDEGICLLYLGDEIYADPTDIVEMTPEIKKILGNNKIEALKKEWGV